MSLLKEIENTYERIFPYIDRTPVITSRTLNTLFNTNLFFKCENFQRGGSFKVRGAFNKLLQLSIEDKKKGIIAHSSGNHAQAVALACKELNIKSTIVMPLNASNIKKKATKSYGATIIECGNNPIDRTIKTNELITKHGYILVHPYNDDKIILGTATIAYELTKDMGYFDYIIVPIGGGGLISGISIALKSIYPNTKIIGVEPENANDAYLSFKDGTKIYPSVNPKTIADGLRTSLGDITFNIIKNNVDDIITVSENQIIDSMQLIWERLKIIVEPSGAVPLAGIIKISNNHKKYPLKDKRVVLILSGGNIDLSDIFNSLRKNLSI